jgi:hypothetical protein
MEGDVKQMVKIPVSSLLPAVGLYYLAQASEKVVFGDDFIEYGFSPNTLNLISKSANDKLKAIETEFETGDKDKTAFQAIIDENFVNSLFASVASHDKMYSVRDFMSKDPRFRMFTQMLST